MRYSTTLISLSSETFPRVLSLISSYGWNVYNSKYGFFISDKECGSLKDVMDTNYIGIKFMTSRVIKVLKKLENNNKAKKYNTLYDPKAMISREEVEIFTTENGVKFKNLKNSCENYDTVKLINFRERTIW